ncbi:Fungal specific transcription factor [Metarhizium robertsii ARSEF 23]|uniref:Fungal specific transcription factor n=1 Tax=Metarhizium robertsii (strain ARSEF 23 / ATCC MYA-3075) TaxID=655844 RepID=E9EVZ3_METRA|nr:Fungal specific transcription factor [Metarhizium robertsii ARSEF 23]EFZ00415.2 Fungal specific transcription factor [Metarhizium robertsii ARSEF 23]
MAAAASTSVPVDDSNRETGYNRSACTECQRRKQKCNREWPCDRCQRRKIADECRYNYSNPMLDTPAHDLTEKLKRTHDDYSNRGTAEADDEDGTGFDALATRLYATLGIDHGVSEKPAPKQDFVAADSSPQMRRVLQLLPQRQSMGKSFLFRLPC